MGRFVSTFINKVDAKGRISVPATFRNLIAQEGLDGIYCRVSPHNGAIDAGGEALLKHFDQIIDSYQLDPIVGDEAIALHYGSCEFIRFDSEGRVAFPETIRRQSGIDTQAAFIGRRDYFQIWQPSALDTFLSDAKTRWQQRHKAMAAPS